ncbi:glycosyltransferase family 2 protein [soil metagenome]
MASGFDAKFTLYQPVMMQIETSEDQSPTLSVIVPVFNEIDTVGELVDRVSRVPVTKQIVMVDDGSTDGSLELLRDLVDAGVVDLVAHSENRGKGAAIRSGIGRARGRIVLIQDADLEYDPAVYPSLLLPFELDPACKAVYGSRFRGTAQHMSRWHRFGNRFVTRLFNLLYRTTLTDMETCYKAIDRAAFSELTLKSDRWGFDPEITAKLVRQGVTIVEIPVDYVGRDLTDGKKLRWKDGFSVVVAIVRFRCFD